MDSIAITKPNMGTLPQDRPGLSPFGILSQAFSQELLAGAGFQEGRWPFVALDLLLEEGEEAPAGPPPVQPVVQVDLRLILQHLRQSDIRTEKAVERVVERVIRLREQGRPQGAPSQPAARGGGRNGTAGRKNQAAGSEAAGEGRVQGRVRDGLRQAVSGASPGGGRNAPQTPEPAVSAAGSFAHLQNFYNTIHQHLQFTANIRQPGIGWPDGPVPPQGSSGGLSRRSAELFRRIRGLRREWERLPFSPAVSAGVSSLAGGTAPLAVGNTSNSPSRDAARRNGGYPPAGEPVHLENGTGSAGMNGAADATARSRGLRREARRMEQALAAQAPRPDEWASMRSARTLPPDAWGSMRSAQTLPPDAWGSMRSTRTLPPDAWGSMRSARTLPPDAWGSMRSARTLPPDAWRSMLSARMPRPDAWGPMLSAWMLPPDAWRSMPSARTLPPDAWRSTLSARMPHPDAWGSMSSARTFRRDVWNAMLELDLWNQSAGGEMSGQEKAAGGPPRSIRQRSRGAERPMLGSEKAAFAPPGGIPAIETAAPADQARWGKSLWSVPRLSALSPRLGAEAQSVAVPPRDTSVPAPPMGGELAHGSGTEKEGLPRQAAFKAEPVERGVLGDRAAFAAAEQSAPILRRRAVPDPGEPTAREAGPMGADAAAQTDQLAFGPGGLPSMSPEKVRQSPAATETWPRAEAQEEPAPPPFSGMLGGELAHRAARTGPEWDFGPSHSTGRAQTSVDKARDSADRARTAVSRTRIPPDTPARPLEAAGAAEYGQVPQAAPPKPPVSALQDIRTVKVDQNAAESGEAAPRGTPQTAGSLSAPFAPGDELTHPADLYRDSVPTPAETGVRPPAALTAQLKEPGPQASSPQRKARRAEAVSQTGGQETQSGALLGKTRQGKPVSQTGGHGTQSGSPRRRVQTGSAAGPAGRAEGIATLGYTPLAVSRRQNPLTVVPRDIRPFAVGRVESSAGVKGPREGRSAALYQEILPPGEMVYGGQSKDTAGAGVAAPREKRSAPPYQGIMPPGEMVYGVRGRDTAGAGTEAPRENRSAPPYQGIMPPGEMVYGGQSKDTAGAGVAAPREKRSAPPYQGIMPPGEMVYGGQSKDTAGAGVAAPREKRSAPPYQGIMPPGEMVYGVRGRDTAGAGTEAPRENRSAPPYQEILPPGETAYGVQNRDMAGIGTDAQNRTVPDLLELTYGGTARHPAADAPAPAARGPEQVHGPMESDYVRGLPDWARRFLREGAPQTREEAVRRLGTGREQTMGTARSIAALPSFSEEGGTAFQWTAPDTRVPAPVEYREPRRQQDPPQPQSIRISDAELQRTADRVYRIIEDRVRRERWRLGL